MMGEGCSSLLPFGPRGSSAQGLLVLLVLLLLSGGSENAGA